MLRNNKQDWCGLCLEMMSEYFPVEIRSKTDSEKYWNICEHLLCLMEHSELINRRSKDEELDKRNDLVRRLIEIFATNNRGSTEAVAYDTEMNIDNNVTLSNLLFLSLIN